MTVRASPMPENHAGPPSSGRTAIARARSRATARRAGLLLPQSRVGCTRLVSRITNESDSGSITTEVPVKPVCPKVTGVDRPSMYHRWSSSKPSPCEFVGELGCSR